MKIFYALTLLVVSIFMTSMAIAENAKTGTAVLAGTEIGSPLAGTARFTDTPEGLRVSVEVQNAPPGRHGLHIHEFGSCADGGAAAGGHYNPDHVSHGNAVKEGPEKAHPGDLGNLEVGDDGTGSLEAVLPGVTLSGGPRSVGGRAMIFHDKEDDFGQPTGNAGGRIGCGPILLTNE